jgi:lipopolysaccharide export system protein LptA
VTLVGPTEAAEGREAVFEVATQTVLMSGDVLLTQDLSAVSGDRLVIDLATGAGVVEGRVRTVLRTGGN